MKPTHISFKPKSHDVVLTLRSIDFRREQPRNEFFSFGGNAAHGIQCQDPFGESELATFLIFRQGNESPRRLACEPLALPNWASIRLTLACLSLLEQHNLEITLVFSHQAYEWKTFIDIDSASQARREALEIVGR